MNWWIDEHTDEVYEFEVPAIEVTVSDRLELLGPDGEPVCRQLPFGFVP